MGIIRQAMILLGGISLLFVLVYHIDVKAKEVNDDEYIDYLVQCIESPQPALDYSQEEIYLNYLAEAVLGSEIHIIDYSQIKNYEDYLVQVVQGD